MNPRKKPNDLTVALVYTLALALATAVILYLNPWWA